MGPNVVFDPYNCSNLLDWALPLVAACVQQSPAIVACELGEVSTGGQDYRLRTPSAGVRPMMESRRHPGVDAGGPAETKAIIEVPMAGSVLSESKTNNLMVFSRSGCFGLNSNRSLNGLTIEETIEFKALEALPPFDENGNIAWTFEGEPTTSREKRWLELYVKQERTRQKGETPDQPH
jgi:hypothetical protein